VADATTINGLRGDCAASVAGTILISTSKTVTAASAALMTLRISLLRDVPLQQEDSSQRHHSDRRMDGCSRGYRRKERLSQQLPDRRRPTGFLSQPSTGLDRGVTGSTSSASPGAKPTASDGAFRAVGTDGRRIRLCNTRSAAISRPQTQSRSLGSCSTSYSAGPFLIAQRSVRVTHVVTATRVHIACNRATARCIASTSAAVVSSLPLLHIPLKAAPSSMIILS
jgi:hypothetical protein